jgi:predicted  nucleic acid-binding Zn-ribbon protein
MTDLVESLSAQVHDIDIGAAAMNDKPERRIKMSAKRDAYMEKLKARLDKWNADIDKLAAKAAQEKKKAKVEYQKQLDDLLAKRDDVRDKLSAMQQAGEGAWEDLKEGLDNSWEILKMSFDKAKSEFEKEYKKGTKA